MHPGFLFMESLMLRAREDVDNALLPPWRQIAGRLEHRLSMGELQPKGSCKMVSPHSSFPMTTACPYLLPTSTGAHQRAGSHWEEEEESSTDLHPLQILSDKVSSASRTRAQA